MSADAHLEHVLTFETAQSCLPRRGLLGWDARLKLALLVAVIVGNTWLALPGLSAGLLLLGVILLAWTRLPWAQQRAFLLAPLLPTALVVLGMGVGFGATPLWHAGPVVFYQEGLLKGGFAALRAYCDIIWLLACISATPFPELLGAMRWFRIPAILVDTLAMMYRYIFVLYIEFGRMRLAAHARGGCAGRRAEMAALSQIAGHLLLRAFDRSERVYLAMAARGGEQHD